MSDAELLEVMSLHAREFAGAPGDATTEDLVGAFKTMSQSGE